MYKNLNSIKTEDFKVDRTLIEESWNRCISIGLSRCIAKPTIIFQGETLNKILQANKPLIDITVAILEDIRYSFIESICGILCDSSGVILSIICSNDLLEDFGQKGIRVGASIKEISVGTNAVSLAMELKKPVVLTGGEHYCEMFWDWQCIALPLFDPEDNLVGYLDFSSWSGNLEQHIATLIAVKKFIESELRFIAGNKLYRSSIKITNRQLEILKLLEKGMSYKTISDKLYITVNTVKFHVKKIYELLEVKNQVECIGKAKDMGII